MFRYLRADFRKQNVNKSKVFLFKRDSGFGLAEVLIAGAVGAAVIAALSVGLRSMQRFTNKTESTVDLIGIKSKVISSVDCARTLPAPCANGAYVPLLNSAGTPVVAGDGTAIGKFTIRGQCVNSGGVLGIDVRAAWLSAAGMADKKAREFNANDDSWFRADEVNQKLPYSWNHPKAFIVASAPGAANLLCNSGSAGGTVPRGGIIMWSGSAATIPPGWALCDGTAGTPNLSDRFIVGSGPVYGAAGTYAGTTGNSVSFTISTAQMPAHRHPTSFDGRGYAYDGHPREWIAAGAYAGWPHGFRVLHTENFSMSQVGGGAPVTIAIPRPNYFTVAFIMKL